MVYWYSEGKDMIERERAMVTTVRLDPVIWAALRRLAESRALALGGRPSASGVVRELIEAEVAKREGPHAS